MASSSKTNPSDWKVFSELAKNDDKVIDNKLIDRIYASYSEMYQMILTTKLMTGEYKRLADFIKEIFQMTSEFNNIGGYTGMFLIGIILRKFKMKNVDNTLFTKNKKLINTCIHDIKQAFNVFHRVSKTSGIKRKNARETLRSRIYDLFKYLFVDTNKETIKNIYASFDPIVKIINSHPDFMDHDKLIKDTMILLVFVRDILPQLMNLIEEKLPDLFDKIQKDTCVNRLIKKGASLTTTIIKSRNMNAIQKHFLLVMTLLQKIFFMIDDSHNLKSQNITNISRSMRAFHPVGSDDVSCDDLLRRMGENIQGSTTLAREIRDTSRPVRFRLRPRQGATTQDIQQKRRKLQQQVQDILSQEWVDHVAPPVSPRGGSVMTQRSMPSTPPRAIASDTPDRSLRQLVLGTRQSPPPLQQEAGQVGQIAHVDVFPKMDLTQAQRHQINQRNLQLRARKQYTRSLIMEDMKAIFSRIVRLSQEGRFDAVYIVDVQNITRRAFSDYSFGMRNETILDGTLIKYIQHNLMKHAVDNVLWIMVTQKNSGNPIIEDRRVSDNVVMIEVGCKIPIKDDHKDKDCFTGDKWKMNPMDDLVIVTLVDYFNRERVKRAGMAERRRINRLNHMIRLLDDIYESDERDEFDFIDYMDAMKAIETWGRSSESLIPPVYEITFDKYKDFKRY